MTPSVCSRSVFLNLVSNSNTSSSRLHRRLVSRAVRVFHERVDIRTPFNRITNQVENSGIRESIEGASGFPGIMSIGYLYLSLGHYTNY
jgi:hypothetical protein